jgi:hypothetical protein
MFRMILTGTNYCLKRLQTLVSVVTTWYYLSPLEAIQYGLCLSGKQVRNLDEHTEYVESVFLLILWKQTRLSYLKSEDDHSPSILCKHCWI